MIASSRTKAAVYGTAADVYSLTITMWHILVPGKCPWEGRSHLEVYTEVTKGNRPPIPSSLSVGCSQLLTRGWAPNPADRPDMNEIVLYVHHLWLLSTHQQGLTRTGRMKMHE